MTATRRWATRPHSRCRCLPAATTPIDQVEVHLNVNGGATSSTGKAASGIDASGISLTLSDGIRDDIVVDPDSGGDGAYDTDGGSSSGGDTAGEGSSSGTFAGDPGDCAGLGDETGVWDFKICDSRSGETGRRVSISRAGSVISRNVHCD